MCIQIYRNWVNKTRSVLLPQAGSPASPLVSVGAVWVYFVLHLLQSQPCSLLPAATAVRSLSLSALNPWLETAGLSLSEGHVQSDGGTPARLWGCVCFSKGGKHFFSFFSSQVFAYKWQPCWLSRKRCGWGEKGTNDKWRWSVMGVKCRGDRKRESCFICLWGSTWRMGGKCHRNHDLSSAAGIGVRKYQFISFNPMHFSVISLGYEIFISTGSTSNFNQKVTILKTVYVLFYLLIFF